MEKFEVKTGAVAVEVQSIINVEEIRKQLGEKATNIDKCTKENKKELTEAIAHYKKIRTPLKNEKAAARKQCDKIKAEVTKEFDEVIGIVSGYIEPYEEKVKEYDEEVKRKKLAKLRDDLEPKIKELNNDIEIINDELGNRLNEPLVFSEKWAKNLKAGLEYIKSYIEIETNKYNQAKNNIAALEILCDTLKTKYDLASDINYKLILGNEVYTGQLTDLQQRLDDFAADQQRAELEAEQRKEEEAERERQKLIEEQRRKEKEAEEQKLRELEAAQEKARQEEREKIAKEKAEEEARIQRIQENDRRLKQQEEDRKTEAAKVKIESEIENAQPVKTRDIKIHFKKLTASKSNAMWAYFRENNIKFEVMK